MVLLGQVLELRAREATSGAPKTARRRGEDGTDHECRSIPSRWATGYACGRAKGAGGWSVILEGRSSLDKSLMTGESIPVTKDVGSKVIIEGVVMRADKVERDTLLSQIVKMVADA